MDELVIQASCCENDSKLDFIVVIFIEFTTDLIGEGSINISFFKGRELYFNIRGEECVIQAFSRGWECNLLFFFNWFLNFIF